MNHWPYIVTAYVLTIGGMGGLALISWLRMRAAEAQADHLTRSSRTQPRDERGAVSESLQ